MSNIKLDKKPMSEQNEIKYTGHNGHIKAEHSLKSFHNNHHCNHSAVMPTGQPPSTILITSNFMQRESNSLAQNNSITILTNNNHSNDLNTGTTNKIAIDTSPSSAFLLDRINICINNHYNNEMSPLKAEPLPAQKSVNLPDETQCQPNDGFIIGQDVLVQQDDSRFYLGTIVMKSDNQCLIKFDDSTRYWASFNQLKLLNSNKDDSVMMCVICKKIDQHDKIEECNRCCRGYHSKCKNVDTLPGEEWYCRICITPKKRRESTFEVSNGAQDVKVNRETELALNTLPYDINSLTWDAKHRVNEEKIYCYCGKSGCWESQMLQCCKCQQWFHGDCITCLKQPLYSGDTFYVFCCCICNNGNEFLRRIEMEWVDIVHLILYNLTIGGKYRKYHHIKKQILVYAIANWQSLQVPIKLRKISENDIRIAIKKTLNKYVSRFQCSKEIKKDVFLWGLRTFLPPPSPVTAIPKDIAITDEYLRTNTSLRFVAWQHKTRFSDFDQSPNKTKTEIKTEQGEMQHATKQTAMVSPNEVTSDKQVEKGTPVTDSGPSTKCSKITVNKRKQYGRRTSSALSKLDDEIPMIESSFHVLSRLFPNPEDFLGPNNPLRLVTPKKCKVMISKKSFGKLSLSKKVVTDFSTKLAALRKSESLTRGNLSSNAEAKKRPRSLSEVKESDIPKFVPQPEKPKSNPHGRLLRQRPEKILVANVARKSNGDNSTPRNAPAGSTTSAIASTSTATSNGLSAAARIALGQTYKVIGKRTLSNGQIQYKLEWYDNS